MINNTQRQALTDMINLESQGLSLCNGAGVSLATVRVLARQGLVTLDEGWEHPWVAGRGKARKARRVWSAETTAAGREAVGNPRPFHAAVKSLVRF